jgi:hypothetical protein
LIDSALVRGVNVVADVEREPLDPLGQQSGTSGAVATAPLDPLGNVSADLGANRLGWCAVAESLSRSGPSPMPCEMLCATLSRLERRCQVATTPAQADVQRAEHHAKEAERLLKGRFLSSHVKAQAHATLAVYYSAKHTDGA